MLKLLSVEQHSFCNLRCTYCSEMFYGGKKPQYDVWGFASKLSQEGSFHNCRQVVWGGGEPTLDKSFENIFKTIQKNAKPKASATPAVDWGVQNCSVRAPGIEPRSQPCEGCVLTIRRWGH